MKNLPFVLLAVIILNCQENITDELTSLKTGSFVDTRDGHVYNTIQIGTQVWMSENLEYSISDSSWYYNNDSASYHIYGRLYTWNSAFASCPPGWHIPTDGEWTILTAYLGGEEVAGGKLKQTGLANWQRPNTGATNESGFTSLPGGKLNGDGPYVNIFDYISNYGYWWTATDSTTIDGWYRCMYHKYANVGRGTYAKTYGLSVRCVKN